jgi:toxin FitB
MNVVDSSAWLAYFTDEPGADLFAEAIEDTELLLVPAVCIYEVFKVILRNRGEEVALKYATAMQQGTVVALDAELALEAAFLGQQQKLALADSIIYAVAQKQNALLWTQDEHFQGLANVRYMPKGKRG